MAYFILSDGVGIDLGAPNDRSLARVQDRIVKQSLSF